MNRKMLMKLAVSGFVLGLTSGCAGTGKMAAVPNDAAGKPAVAAESAEKARQALEDGKLSRAVALAEAAVAASPRDGHYRALLGQAYLNDGRFASATEALSDAMELGVTDSNTVLAMTLAHIAQGKTSQAVALLKENYETIPAPDLGLALALAGDTNSAIYILTEAAQTEGATARMRQNLALALALSGRWAQARIVAAQDLPLAKVEPRMAEWSQLAQQGNPQLRVASLIGATPQADAGMPVRLALSNFAGPQLAAADSPAPDRVLAAAEAAPATDVAPPPPILAKAPAPIRTVELPMPQRDANGVVPVTDLPQPKPAAPVILANAAPYRAAPRVAGAHVRKATPDARDQSARVMPRVASFDSARPTGWAVQLGAYDSLGVAQEKWAASKRRHGVLANYPASSHSATVDGRTFFRLTVNGLASQADAARLCGQLKATGQSCFVRQMGGSETIQWASRAATPIRLASR